MGKIASVNNNGRVTLIDVDDELAKIINNEDCKYRKKAQYHGYCVCEYHDIWKCIGDCPTCKYFSEGKMKHYDEYIEESDTDLWNTVINIDNIPENTVVDVILFREILNEIKELSPEVYRLGELLLQGKSIKCSSESLGIKRTTLSSKRKKIKELIYKKYGNIFRQ